MFVLPAFSVPAWVPQKPGVRQMLSPQLSGSGFAATEWQLPLAGSQTSVVQLSES